MGLKSIFKDTLLLLYYFIKLDEWKFHSFRYKDINKGKKAMVMGNGPSLGTLLSKYERGEVNIPEDTFFVNMSPLASSFYRIRPKHLCLSDFTFAKDWGNERSIQVRKMYSMLQENVNWPLKIYVNIGLSRYCRQLVEFSRIKNSNIEFVFLNRKYCDRLNAPLRNFLYSKGLFMPTEASVVNTAIYLAILEGYSEIELYGVEHDMYKNLQVNSNNQLCILDNNFYHNKPILVPVVNDGNESSVGSMKDYMTFIQKMFNSHYLLHQFADYKKVHILNCTPDSMIDVYERKSGC